MDELVRRFEREALTGDRGAGQRLRAHLRRRGLESTLSVERRIELGLFDAFTTQLRDDIVEEARRVAEEGDPFPLGVNLDPLWWPVELRVNGERLVDLVGGDFNPQLPAHVVYRPSRHLLGEPYVWPRAWIEREDDDKTLLLFCSCADALCGRLVAKITRSERAVVWSGLEQRPETRVDRVSVAATFVFSAIEYEAALRDPRSPRDGRRG